MPEQSSLPQPSLMSTEYSLPVLSTAYPELENKHALKSPSWDTSKAPNGSKLKDSSISSLPSSMTGSDGYVGYGAFGNRSNSLSRNPNLAGYSFATSTFSPYQFFHSSSSPMAPQPTSSPSFSSGSGTVAAPVLSNGLGATCLAGPATPAAPPAPTGPAPSGPSYSRLGSKHLSSSILQMNTTMDDIPVLLRRPNLSSYPSSSPSSNQASRRSLSVSNSNLKKPISSPFASNSSAATPSPANAHRLSTPTLSPRLNPVTSANTAPPYNGETTSYPSSKTSSSFQSLRSSGSPFLPDTFTPSLTASFTSTASSGSIDSAPPLPPNASVVPAAGIPTTLLDPSALCVPAYMPEEANAQPAVSSNLAPFSFPSNNILSFCKDQHGCRYLQRLLEKKNPAYVDVVFNETQAYLPILMVDAFGNYLCQKLFEHVSDAQRSTFVQIIAPKLVPISFNMHGTRALQKIIDLVSSPDQVSCIVDALRPNVVMLTKDLNGNHVIQKCLNKFSHEDCQFIFDAICNDPVDVSTHRHGCCVVQRCFDHASPAQIEQLVQHIIPHALLLVQDAFGNYVLQYVLELNDPSHTETIVNHFVSKIRVLSTQKFSSNVIEKCIFYSPFPLKEKLIAELMDEKFLAKMLRDSFANYVIQTALDNADPKQRIKLAERIKPLIPSIKNTPCGRRIISKLERQRPNLKEKE
ncbi:pumilio family RNA-binding protein Puf4 [Schizosaccharomyces osmophilus]|uniref:Pumilio family RNA-binding protein Puf4 n=1 Tax=Schizosaccharomyces osmophilus TaxID=2545709 RepID=A0AAF0AUP0_9SCHI|nr:pumilio family RNA-binding protein Puf4 [Schizosaccharomyces osmophilus]WBW71089.1 pumilio family RNA-binding protein Puf4 [Schizosaccharomyces osmophilus]